MVLEWLVGVSLMAVTPLVIVGLAGSAVARLAGRSAARHQDREYPTAQMLALTYQEPPEQWPPAPIIEAPLD